jgi:preprotein translocase subunit YajC
MKESHRSILPWNLRGSKGGIFRSPGITRNRRDGVAMRSTDAKGGFYGEEPSEAHPVGTQTPKMGMEVWSLMGGQAVAFLQDPPPAQGDGLLRFLVSILPLVFFFFIFYIFLILPTQRQQKKHRQLLASLKVGDRVVTNSGIYGTIVKVGEKTFKLRVADKVVITVEKSAIAGLQPAESEAEV